jgi:stage V sporulation protein B
VGQRGGVSEEDTRKAGRGLLLITSAKVVFIVTAFAVTVVLPRQLGPAIYGIFSVAFGAASLLNNVLIASTVQTVSKIVSDDEEKASVALRHGLLMQIAIGAFLGIAFLLAGPLLADRVYHDTALIPLFRISAGVAFAYAVYATLVGYLNGRRKFLHQAGLDMTFSILRTTGLIGGALLGIGAVGATAGFGVAAAIILAIALATIGIGTSGAGFSPKRFIALTWPIWFYQGCVQAVMQIDLQLLKYWVTAIAMGAGTSEADAVEAANVLAGQYSAAQKFAFVPYQLILSVTFIVFPFVSRAVAGGDREAAKRYIHNAMRFSVVVLCAMAAPIAGAASGVMRIAVGAEFLPGAEALGVLALGQVGFALFVIGATILTGSGRPIVAASIAFVSVIVVVVAVSVGIHLAGVEGSGALIATAIGTSLGTGLAFVAVGIALRVGLGAFIPLRTAIRTLIAGGAAYTTARFIPHDSAAGALAALVGGSVVYVIVLIVSGEIGKKDLETVKTILARKKKS